MIKIGINCLLVVALTFAGVMAMLLLPVSPASPNRWAGEYFDTPTALGLWFIYSILLWAVFAALIAGCMLVLKPRNVVWYGLASAITFIVTMQSWYLFVEGNSYALVRELVFVLTIPYLYWVFVRIAQRRHEKSANTDAEKAGPIRYREDRRHE